MCATSSPNSAALRSSHVTTQWRHLPGTNLDNEVQRRHRIVHAGARVIRQDAEASIEAAKALIDFLHWPSMRIYRHLRPYA